tara:strand:- start:1300 stop:1539 length:240 start_codon:yes stop_codon:yes gene_type:complete
MRTGVRYESTQEASEFVEGMEENKEGISRMMHRHEPAMNPINDVPAEYTSREQVKAWKRARVRSFINRERNHLTRTVRL